MSATTIIEKVTEIARRVTSSEGLELVEVEWKGGGNNWVLRIFIDKEGGVTLSDCEMVSRQVGVILDVEEVIPVRYTLEVSSPGLDRKLLKPADYQRFLGKKAKVSLRAPVDGRRHFVGRLAEFEAGQVGLEVEGGRRVQFPLEEVQTARLVVEF
ncbi:MAG: ribosome maturation factor RimP [Acidobacteria bacterium]|nr:ribosome maturation factor RimP [Acidobacteriota bacterium]